MATGISKQETTTEIRCFCHQQEFIRLFCTKCESAICLTCLIDNHNQHPVQAISNIQQFISQKVAEWCSDDENAKVKLGERKSLLYTEIKKIEDYQLQIENEIQNCENVWLKKLETGSNQLIYDAKQISTKNVEYFQSIIHDLEECEEGLQNFDNQSATLKLYCRLKMCMDPQDHSLLTCSIPLFIKKIPGKDFATATVSVGEKIDENCSLELRNNLNSGQSIVTTSVDKQVQIDLDTDLETSSSDDVDIPESTSCVQNRIGLPSSELTITKILPISLNDAWLLSNRRLCKLEQNKIIYSKYTEEVDDFVILKSGQFLILNRENPTIFRIITNGKKLPFTSTGPGMPLCMTMSDDNKSVFVFMRINVTTDNCCFCSFDLNGMCVKIFNFRISFVGASNLLVPCEANFTVLLNIKNSSDVWSNKSSDVLSNQVTSYTCNEQSLRPFSNERWENPPCCSFRGKIGFNTFECNGICHDSRGSILVSDHIFHKVYLLDSSLNFKKILLDFETGIRNPSTLSFKDGYLWVVNATEIIVFNYDNIKE